MENRQPTIIELLLEAHIGLDRQGPGSRDAVKQALKFLGPLDRISKTADLGCGTGGQTLELAEHLSGSITGLDMFPDFIEILNQKTNTKTIVHLSEGAVGQLASSLTGDGLLALSGTGSDCFLNKDADTYDMIGGWGAAFGDEGSGYWMGCEAIRGALRSYDGRGKKSLLETLIPEQYGYKKNIRKVVKLYRSDNQRKDIASATKSLSKAMWEGDEVAHDIIIQAAELMAEQAITLLKKHEIPKGMKFTVAGGGWKVSNLMIDHFAGLVLTEFPDMEFVYPEFEPVTGGIIHTILRTQGEITEEKAEDLRKKLQDYQFITDDMKYKAEIIQEAIRLAKTEG